jgi:hypothetical protein
MHQFKGLLQGAA